MAFPKGCHYHEIADGEVSKRFKMTQPVKVERLVNHSTEYLVVRARSGIMWRLFKNRAPNDVVFVARSLSFDALVMQALLSN